MSEPFDPYRKWLGIPPKDQPPNHYRLLAVELFEDDLDIISNASDRLMAHVRTFQAGPHSAESQQLLNEIAAAGHCLLDPAKKAAYDQALRNQLLMAQAAQNSPSSPVPPVSAVVQPTSAPVAPPPMPIASPAPVAVPVPQPVAVAPAGETFAAPVVTVGPAHRRTSWHAPVAVAIIGATALSTTYFLLQLNRQAASPAQPNVAGADATAESTRPGAADERAPAPSLHEQPGDGGAPVAPGNAANKSAAGLTKQDSQRRESSQTVRNSAGVNLLKLIDPARDAVQGDWRMEQGALISPDEETPRLAIPFRLPPEYELTAVVQRRNGDDAFGMGLIADAFKAAALVDGWHGAASGLSLIDGRSAEGNETTRLGRVLREESPSTLRYFVADSGVRLVANGETIFDFRGEVSRLSWPPNFGSPVPGRLELIGSRGSVFVILALELKVLADPARIAGPIREAAPASAGSESNATVSADQERMQAIEARKTLGRLLNGPQAAGKQPTPQELATAERQARQQFRSELAGARLPEQKEALARDLVDRGYAAQNDLAMRCALMRLASEVAAEGGHIEDAIAAIDRLRKWRKIDANELKIQALVKAGKAPNRPELKQEVLRASVDLAEQFVAEDEYAKAGRALAVGQAAARSLKDPDRARKLADRKSEVESLAEAYLALAPDLARLAEDENNDKANLNVGKFYCLTKQQWDRGLPYLTLSSDPACRALAADELAKPDSAAAHKNLADGWWDLAQKEMGPAQAAMLKRACDWYRRAAPFLSGRERETAEMRITQIDAGEPTSGAGQVYLADLNEANVNADGNRLFRGTDDDGNDLMFNGALSPKGLLLRLPASGLGGATYIINRKYRSFVADVGIVLVSDDSLTDPLTFELVGDGALLWRSQEIEEADQTDHCEANVSKVTSLELRVVCNGDAGAKAVWIKPRLKEK